MAAAAAVLARHPALPQFPHPTTVKRSLKALPVCDYRVCIGKKTHTGLLWVQVYHIPQVTEPFRQILWVSNISSSLRLSHEFPTVDLLVSVLLSS